MKPNAKSAALGVFAGVLTFAAIAGSGIYRTNPSYLPTIEAHAAGAALPEGFAGMTEARVREIIREEIARNPKAIIDSLDAYMKEQQANEAKAAEGQAVAQKAAISDTKALPFYGNPDGKIELVYFFDVNCGYCKRLDPSMKRIVAENPDVRVSLREIPILAKSSHLAATLEGLVWKLHPKAYLGFHDSLMGHQGQLSDGDVATKLTAAVGDAEAARLLKAAGDVANDPDAREVNGQVQESLSIARDAGITGTPFVYVLQGDGLLRGAGTDAYEQLNGLLAKARAAIR